MVLVGAAALIVLFSGIGIDVAVRKARETADGAVYPEALGRVDGTPVEPPAHMKGRPGRDLRQSLQQVQSHGVRCAEVGRDRKVRND